jgi:hypothetical protein
VPGGNMRRALIFLDPGATERVQWFEGDCP